MKKRYMVAVILSITIAYFYFERYSFNQYIHGSNQSGLMNIPINEEAPVKSRNQIEIKAPVNTIWEILTDIKAWPTWQKAVTETHVADTVGEGTPFNWKAGGLSFQSKIHTSKPPTAFGWTGETFGARAIHNWTFIDRDTTTLVVVEESLQGVFPKLFRGYFQKNLDKGVLTNLEELKAASEAKIR